MTKTTKNTNFLPKAMIGTGLFLLLVAGLSFTGGHSNDLHNSSVMIVNRAQNSGGTGIIYKSENNKSYVLTNAHVCHVVENGGLVVGTGGKFQVATVQPSKQSDLCMLTVNSNLNVNTDFSKNAPKWYDEIKVSGHPALMPNIISKGHVSGKDILPIMVGLRPCTDDEFTGPNAQFCIFFGGMPVVKYYESTLVSATIMPGSSGSGVYNARNELVGVVFAGSKDFGYAWTVPYEQVKAFLEGQNKDEEKQVDQTLSFNTDKKESFKDAMEKCQSEKITDETIQNMCSMILDNELWFQ